MAGFAADPGTTGTDVPMLAAVAYRWADALEAERAKRALSQPREPTPSPASPITTADAERARYALGAFPLCPEHAIRLPCPACATREGGK